MDFASGALAKRAGVTVLTALSVEFPERRIAIRSWKGECHPFKEGSGEGKSLFKVFRINKRLDDPFISFIAVYFPMQNLLKISPKTLSVTSDPDKFPIECNACLRSKARHSLGRHSLNPANASVRHD